MGLTTQPITQAAAPAGPARLPFYYGWVNVVAAAAAMVATLPGRTHGLGLITEPLLRDLGISRVSYGQLNTWATLIGAAFCLSIGRLIDRFGTRVVLVVVAAALGVVVLAMAGVTSGPRVLPILFVLVMLTRGLGQSALSVVSLTIVGKWFTRRLSVAMAVYSLLVGLGFTGAVKGMGWLLSDAGVSWRAAWSGLGVILLIGMAPLGALLVRRSPEDCGLPVDGLAPEAGGPPEPEYGLSLAEALRTPAFWAFAVATSLYNLIASGISLFNQSILEDRGFDKSVFFNLVALTTLVSLAVNFLSGWLIRRWAIGPVLGLAMATLCAALLSLPHVTTRPQVMLYGLAMGAAGGVVTVVFFTIWGHAFGRRHLAKIQGVAQMLTVLASAVGPLLLAVCKERTGSYTLMFYALAPAAALLGVAVWLTPLPDPRGTLARSASEGR